MSSKRQAGRQLTRDDPDEDEDRYGPPIVPGVWQKADEATLAKRVIRKAKRPVGDAGSSLPLPASNPFANVELTPRAAANPFANIQLAPPASAPAANPFASIQLALPAPVPAAAAPAMASTLARRTLGSGAAALAVSAQGFGCMGITANYGKPMVDDEAVVLLQHAYSLGVTHWDTAEVYTCKATDGSTIYNETVVGKAIAAIGKRDELQIATKYMPTTHSDIEMTEEMVLAACRASCARLGIDRVDLYYVHRFHPTVPVGQQARAMKAVLDAGLARCVGLSEFSPRNVRSFHAICPVTCVQQEWSLMSRDLEEDLVPTCRELGIGIVACAPTRRIRTQNSPFHPRSTPTLSERAPVNASRRQTRPSAASSSRLRLAAWRTSARAICAHSATAASNQTIWSPTASWLSVSRHSLRSVRSPRRSSPWHGCLRKETT